MGHINRKNMDVLRRMPGSGVDNNGDIQACDVFAVRKTGQQAHPTQATYDVHHAFQLVTVDLMRSIKPTARGGYSYVTKFVDQHTKWKEIFIIKTKPQALDALERYNKALVIPNNKFLTEFMSSEFRQYCHDIGVLLEFASPNTPQQIASKKRAGRTIAGIVRCLLVDSGLRAYYTFSGES